MMDANSRCYGGNRGYLVNIDSAQENLMLLAYVQNHHNYKPGDFAWIGASDLNAEGTFRWTGPGRHNSGVPFWEGGTDGTAVKGRSTTKTVLDLPRITLHGNQIFRRPV